MDVLKIVFFSALEFYMKYAVCLCKGCDGCCVSVCIVTHGAVCANVWEV